MTRSSNGMILAPAVWLPGMRRRCRSSFSRPTVAERAEPRSLPCDTIAAQSVRTCMRSGLVGRTAGRTPWSAGRRPRRPVTDVKNTLVSKASSGSKGTRADRRVRPTIYAASHVIQNYAALRHFAPRHERYPDFRSTHGVSLISTDTLCEVWFTTAKSGFPSPLKSATLSPCGVAPAA